MGSQRHVILRQTVELTLVREDDAWNLQQEASRIMRMAQPLIERCCDDLSSSDRLYRIERLELDLGAFDANRLEDELLTKFGQTLLEGLAEQIRRQDSTEPPPRLVSQLELLAQFARLGSLPWWADLARSDQPLESLDLLLREAPGLLERLLTELAQDSNALQRLAWYFDDRRLAALVLLKAPALADFPTNLCRSLLTLSDYLPVLAAMSPTRLRNRIWQSILGTAVLSPQPPTNPVDFSREVLMYLARLQDMPYPALLQGFSRAAAEGRFEGTAEEVEGALEAQDALLPRPVQTPPHRLWGEETSEAALKELQLWLDNSELIPSWLKSWLPPLREALFDRLDGMGGSLADALAELKCWLENGAQGQEPSWLRSWPPLLREEFSSCVWNLGKRLPDNSEADRKEGFQQTFRHEKNDFTTVDSQKLWEQILEQAGFSDADSIYLGNAGLVILWPFLKAFFGRLGLLEENNFLNESARQRAVALLQFLADGDAAPAEHLLPLPKLLCGMALESVFELDQHLNEEELAECENLLEAVIEQAPILNDMSIQGFRGSFLLRTGILEVRDGAWLLRVERETYDLVLDRFPWGFAWVKLPWMEAPLQVEW